MSDAQIVLLGAVAGATIFLGLPLARLRRGGSGTKTFLNGLSAGILVFLLFEILKQATAPVEEAVEEAEWAELAGLGVVYALGLGVGLLGLLYAARMWRARFAPGSPGPGAMAVAEAELSPEREALRLGLSIASGIGLHNFSEGLAIGQSAAAGEISLAVLLVVGFALHNATEGFGIVGPLAAAGVRPTWAWLSLVGVIGGGPTLLGTVVGTAFTSVFVFVAFLALAAGAILYVVGELFVAGRRLSWAVTLWGILGGFLLALATELVIEAAGG